MFCRVGEKITLVKAGNHTGGKRMRAGSAGPVTRGEYQHKTGSTRQWKKGNFTCGTKRDNNHIWHISNQHRAVLILLWQFQDSEAVYRLSSQKNILHDGAKLTFVRDFSAETMHRRWEFNTAWKPVHRDGNISGISTESLQDESGPWWEVGLLFFTAWSKGIPPWNACIYCTVYNAHWRLYILYIAYSLFLVFFKSCTCMSVKLLL